MKQTTFYCEHCGKPVSIESSTCPSCGNTFKAVKCPVCSFIGGPALFYNGCPSCGYLYKELQPETSTGKSVRNITESRPRRTPAWLIPVISIFLVVMIVILAVVLLR